MTYSILVRDARTGALGAAVASRFFAVGAMCIHVEGGVAAMSVQAFTNPMYVVRAMPRLRAREAPQAIVSSLVAPDPGQPQRQFHVLDAQGRLAQHTGPDCVGWAGQVQGTDVSVAGNMLAGPAVVQWTMEGFLDARGSLAERLIAALQAGEDAGGDKRGKQSAAVRVCSADPYPDVDIRTDDHPDPLSELRRLYAVSLERFAIFRRHLAGTNSEWGTLDRAVIEADVQRDGVPAPSGDCGPRM